MYGEKALPIDLLLRSISFEAASHESLQKLQGKDEVENVKVYCQGFNDAAQHFPLPLEFSLLGIGFRPLDIMDIFAILRLIDLSLASDFWAELGRQEIFDVSGGDLDFVEELLPFRARDDEMNSYTTLDDNDLKQSGLYHEKKLSKR